MADENSLWRDRNKVFVAGIPAHADDDALYQKFRTFGEMFQSKVVYDARTGKSKGFGFLTFANYEHALEAVAQMNQAKWEKRVLNVRFLQPKSEDGPSGGGAAVRTSDTATAARSRPAKVFGPCPEGCTSVYVGNLAYGITEPVLRKVFATCGDIKAVRFAEHIETKEFRGFGYVQFYDGAACEKAVRNDGMVVMGRPMNIDYGSRDEATEKAREDLTRKLKKGVCHRFQSGECPRGDDCKFAHVLSAQDADKVLHSVPATAVAVPAAFAPAVPIEEEPVDDGPPVCQSFLNGKCKRGDKCKFRHEEGAAVPDATAPVVAPAHTDHSHQYPRQHHEPQPQDDGDDDSDASPVCQSFLKGKCKRGDKCKFRHTEEGSAPASTPVQLTPSVRQPSYLHSRYAPPPQAPADVNVDASPVCQSFLKGTCKRGDKCKFRHVEATEAAAVTVAVTRPPVAATAVRVPVPRSGPVSDVPVCLNYQKGTCTRGDACRFRHVEAGPETVTVSETVTVAETMTESTTSKPRVERADRLVATATSTSTGAGPTAAGDDDPICQNFLKGKCKRGDKCRFRHVDAADVPVIATPDVVPTISICQNFQRGRCVRGTSCRFAHTSGLGDDMDMDVDAEAPARAPVAVVAAAAVTTAHSDYQKRFQSVCYNWQNKRSCVRGDACPFYHDGALQPMTERRDDDDKAAPSEKKEKKVKKEKKRKADSDSDSDSDSDADKKKKKKKKQKKASA